MIYRVQINAYVEMTEEDAEAVTEEPGQEGLIAAINQDGTFNVSIEGVEDTLSKSSVIDLSGNFSDDDSSEEEEG